MPVHREGQPGLPPQVVVGWKIWYADGSVVAGTTREEWAAAPDDGVLVVMLYYNRFSTDGKTRYRRVCSGDDFYWLSSGTLDHIYGHGTNHLSKEQILKNHPDALIKTGRWTDDAHFKVAQEAAMADHFISHFGLTPEPDTEDR